MDLDAFLTQSTTQTQQFYIQIPISNNSYAPMVCNSSLVFDIPRADALEVVTLPGHIQLIHRDAVQASQGIQSIQLHILEGKLSMLDFMEPATVHRPAFAPSSSASSAVPYPDVVKKILEHMPDVDIRSLQLPTDVAQLSLNIGMLKNSKGEVMPLLQALLGSRYATTKCFNALLRAYLTILPMCRVEGVLNPSSASFTSHLGEPIRFQVLEKSLTLEAVHSSIKNRKTFVHNVP